MVDVEYIPNEHDPVASCDLEIKLSNRLTSVLILEAKEPEHSLQNSEEEERDSHDKSVSPPIMLKDHQHDSVTLHGHDSVTLY